MDNLRSNFLEIKEPGIGGVFHREWEGRVACWRDFAAELDQTEGMLLRRGGGQGITQRCDLFGESVFVKKYPPDKLHRRLRDLVGKLRSLREWECNVAAAEAGIATARVLAAFSVRAPFRTRHYFISSPAPGESIQDLLKRAKGDPAEREKLLALLAAFVHDIHGKGLFHAHLNCPHIFMTAEGAFSLIDLERAEVSPPLATKKIERNLDQVSRSISRLLGPEGLAEFRRLYEKP